MGIDSSLIVAIVVLVLFGFVYFCLFIGMYRSRKRTLFARLEDDAIEQEIYEEYTEFQTDYENMTFEEFLRRDERKSKRASVVSGIFCLLVSLLCVGVLAFGMVARSRGDQVFFGDTAVLVVRSGSMREKNDSNRYLFENGLDDQIDVYEMITITRDLSQIDLYDIVAFKGKDGETDCHRSGCGNPGDRVYGGVYICGDSGSASYRTLHHPGDPGIPRVDPSLFPVQGGSEEADGEDHTADRGEI